MIFCIECAVFGITSIPVIGWVWTKVKVAFSRRQSQRQRFHKLFCARCGEAKVGGVLPVCDCEEA